MSVYTYATKGGRAASLAVDFAVAETPWQFEEARLTLEATMNATFSITLDSNDGALYDHTFLGGSSGAVNSSTYITYQPTRPHTLVSGDSLTFEVSGASASGASWGLQVIYSN